MVKTIRLNLEDRANIGLPSGWSELAKMVFYPILAIGTATCSSPTAPTPNGDGGNKTPTAIAAGSVRGGYNGTANFGGVSGNVNDGDYNVGPIALKNTSKGDIVEGLFSGDEAYLPRWALFLLMPGTNRFPLIDVIESSINGITINPEYLASMVNISLGGGWSPKNLEGVANWPEGVVPEVLIVEDSFRISGFLFDLYTLNFRQSAIDNAQIYLPQLLLDNPKPGTWRIVNGSYSCGDEANRNKIIFRGGTQQDITIDGRTGVAANFKWIDGNNQVYCAEIFMTDKAGPADANEEFFNASGLEDTNEPSIPGVANYANQTERTSAFDIAYSRARRKMQNKSKITNGRYDTRHFGAISGTTTANSLSSQQDLESTVNPEEQPAQPIVKPPRVLEQQPSSYRPPPDVTRQRKDFLYRQR